MIGSCHECRFAEVAFVDDSPVVECRRFPPVTVPELPEATVTVDDGEELELLEYATAHRFPLVRSDDWCGEFRHG